MKASKQISESLPIMILLTLSGGFMDAYSYLCRGEVFANAQTGNILLFGVVNGALEQGTPICVSCFGICDWYCGGRICEKKVYKQKTRSLATDNCILRGSDIIRRNVYTAGTEFACKQSYIACVRCTG